MGGEVPGTASCSDKASEYRAGVHVNPTGRVDLVLQSQALLKEDRIYLKEALNEKSKKEKKEGGGHPSRL